MLQPGRPTRCRRRRPRRCSRPASPKRCGSRSGNAVAPPVGPAATTVDDVSLLGADLLKAGPAPIASPQRLRRRPLRGRKRPACASPRAAPPRRRRRPSRPRRHRQRTRPIGFIAAQGAAGHSSSHIRKRWGKFVESLPCHCRARGVRQPGACSSSGPCPAPASRRPSSGSTGSSGRSRRCSGRSSRRDARRTPPAFRRSGGDPIVGRDARPAPRRARTADERHPPPVGREWQSAAVSSKPISAKLRTDQEQRIARARAADQRGGDGCPVASADRRADDRQPTKRRAAKSSRPASANCADGPVGRRCRPRRCWRGRLQRGLPPVGSAAITTRRSPR